MSLVIERTQFVDYGKNIKGVFIYNRTEGERMEKLRYDQFIQDPENYTLIGLRSKR
ncbi:hypothetical protein [Anditalea andensis]|uniref:hypothetical protein n=1 Tax=Anditalea andensis TaxID=1048983 RepID=UPI0013E0C644|nr:hypothetical protein [Anditalea andensis]